MLRLLAAVFLALALALGARPALAQEGEEEGYAMNDVGGELDLPKGWEMQTWSDWDFKAKSPDGVVMRLYLTPFQVEPSAEAVAAWTELYKERLGKDGGVDFTDVQAEVATAVLESGEVAAVRTSMGFTFEKQASPGIFYAAAFPGEGQVIHVETISAARNARKAAAALDQLLAGFALDKGPAETEGPRVASDKAGFAFTAPEGWRVPLAKELSAVRGMTGKVGESGLDPDKCAVAIVPPASGDPDVIFACEMYQHLGIVDEHSWEGVEAEVHELFFGRAEKPVETAEKIQVGDRLGFLYKPPVAGQTVRMVVAPYDKGIVLMWGLSGHGEDESLDPAVRAAATSLEYTHEGGGQPIVALDKRVSYYLKYRPTSPVVLGPAVLVVLLIGGFVVLSRRKGNKYEDL